MGHLLDNKDAHEKRKLLEKIKKIEKKARTRAIRDRKPFKGLQIKPTASFFDDAERRDPGEGNWVGKTFDIHPQVTFISVGILTVFIVLTLMFRDTAEEVFSSLLRVITASTGWFLILSVNLFILAALVFAAGKFGNIRIGGKNARPEFSRPAWFAMLLSAGMGIGLMFWSVGEPISHYVSPSPMFAGIEGNTPAAAQAAMGVTFFHWGLHPWGIYAIVGLGLAFFAYNRGLPLTIRSVFYPLLGDKIYGFWGNLIDVFSVLATLVGLATSLGLGASQINAGLNYLFGIEISTTVQIISIIIITGLATISVVLGLDGGVKRLSEFNMVLAVVFLLFLLIAGPTIAILGGFTQSLGFYISKLPELSFWTETFRGSNWQGGWTVFYWAWWISWSPFVGMFIARVSKGRTVREFIVSVMLIPALLSFIWMSVFGGAAIDLQASGTADIATAVNENVATSLFVMLKSFPMATPLSFVGIFLVVVFFVTSSDSGSLVVDHLTSGGKMNSPVPQRIFWAVMEGLVAAILLLGGGLETLQTASVAAGLPFAIILLIMIYSLYLALSQEAHIKETVAKEVESFLEKERLSDLVNDAVADAEEESPH